MSEPYVGEIRLFPYTFAPNGWFDCDGRLLSIAEYEVLFTLLGTTYGGDGATTFALPDLRGRVPVHQGAGTGLSTYVLGQMAGTETVTLLPSQMPAHGHAFYAVDAAASSVTPSSTLQLGSVSGDTLYTNSTSGIASGDLAPTAVGSAGGNQPHDNTMPTLTARFCIAWAGVYPSQN
ncbi:phage tail protein [Fulvimonas soli]|jgi:microcystin-dependent protein|uniref:Microcystin-dependent protein n=1 Tax=Fulvimonas soli TaxID=155197 RepID=A0A316HWU8_9GAMM|nr:tail fiber protein [Fulvimonas soli]PWK85926.1 microcystin-dependent protein [Fulvimonas soli]TNY26980.1 phage tail protein [Fulvimonas soli]